MGIDMNELDFTLLRDHHGHIKGYRIDKGFTYYSRRYKKSVVIEDGFMSDGASGPAEDILSEAWIVHDKLCSTWKWDDNTPCSNLQASFVLHDILESEGRWIRARSWFLATWLYGPLRYFKCFR